MLFVCLAKSKKHGGRCIAGVEVEPTGRGYRVVRRGREPRWVRPVTDTDNGAVPAHLVRDIRLLQIVEFPGASPVPNGYQAENVSLGEAAHRVVRQLPKSEDVLSHFETTRPAPLFGSRGKAISLDGIAALDHSLLLVRAERVRFYATESARGTRQIRAEFVYASHQYDLPVTHPEFERELALQAPGGPLFTGCYLTLSVGLEFEGWHFKLVAGVFLL